MIAALPDGGSDYDVFVSFAGRDRAFAVELDAHLRSLGVVPFLDQRELRAGLPWIVGLERAIARSRAVAILVGAHGLGNVQQYERDLAVVRQSSEPTFPIVPILIPGCESAPTGFLALWTWVDLRDGLTREGAIEKVRAAFDRDEGRPAKRVAPVCPFMGLEPFREEDAALFCGRDKAIADLGARVREHSLIAVVGRSGSGKSSLVFAGLLPELRKQRPGVVWDVLSVRPGPWPLRALAAAFRTDTAPTDPVDWVQMMDAAARTLRDGDVDVLAGIICRWLDLAPGKPDKLLLYIDQWEELYSMAPGDDGEAKKRHGADVERFIALLLSVASDPRARTCIVLTVRADFYGSLMSHPELGALMPRQQVNIGAMSRDDLRSAVVTPARKAGLSFDPPSLVDDILDDAGTDEAVLPLLQYALKETWTHLREGSVLTADGYTKAGRVLGAIQTTADRTYKALDEREKAVARRLFLGLVTPGEGREDTRALVAMPTDPVMQAVIAKFTDRKARLLVTGSEAVPHSLADGCAAPGAPSSGPRVRGTLEVAHEALIRTWPELRGWLEANRDMLRSRAAIVQQRKEWESNGRRPDLLLAPGFQLERGRSLRDGAGDVPIDDVLEYVQLSEKKDEERSAAQNRAALVERIRLRWLTVSAIIMSVVFALLAMFASSASTRATRAEDAANREKLRAQGETTRAQESLATALYQKGRIAEEQVRWNVAAMYFAAARMQHDTPDARWAAGLADARALVASAHHTGHQEQVNAVAFSPDGQRVLSVDRGGGLRIWSRVDGATRATVKLPKGLWSAAFSPNGDELAVGDETGVIHRFTPELRPLGELRGHAKQIWSLAYSPSGDTLASASEDTTIRLWRLHDGEARILNGHTQRVYSVAFSADGKELASASDDRQMWRWNVATGVGAQRGANPEGGIRAVAFAGTSVVGGSWGASVELWDADAPIDKPSSHWLDKDSIHALSITPDARVLVTAGDSGNLAFWDLTTHTLIAALGTPAGRTPALAISRDGGWLVSAGQSREAVVWDLSALPRLVDAVGHLQGVGYLGMSSDGKKLLSASEDHTLRVWDSATGTQLRAVTTGDNRCMKSAALLGDGTILSACDDLTVRRWDREGHETHVRTKIWMNYGAISADERTFVGGHMNGQVQSLDLTTNTVGPVKTLHHHHIYSVSTTPVGRIATAALDSKLKIWTRTLEPIAEFTADTRDGLLAGALSADGLTAASGSEDGFLEAWNVPTRQHLFRVQAHAGMVSQMTFAGELVYTAGQDGLLKAWDGKTGKLVRTYDAGEGPWVGVATSGDTVLVTGHSTGAIVSWDPATGKPRWRIGGHSRQHGSCDDFSEQTWVDTRHLTVVDAACKTDPATYFSDLAKRSHQRLEAGIDVKANW